MHRRPSAASPNRRRPRRHGLVALAVILWGLVACGRQGHDEIQIASRPLPASFGDPFILSAVPLGSLQTRSWPEPAATRAPVILRFLSEPDAKLGFLAASTGEDGDVAADEFTEYTAPIIMQPPASFWAQATKGDERGARARFDFPFAVEEAWDARKFKAPRLAIGAPPDANLHGPADLTNTSQTLSAPDPTAQVSVFDQSFDVPEDYGSADLTAASAIAQNGTVTIVLTTRTAPKRDPQIGYGFEIGTSGIETGRFGSGATYAYRIELRADRLQVFDKGQSEARAATSGHAELSETQVSLTIPLTELALVSQAQQIAVRPYTLVNPPSFSVLDRTEPFFLRNQFARARHSFQVEDRRFDIDFFIPPALANLPQFGSYGRLAQTYLPELERLTGIRLTQVATIPLYFIDQAEGGYAGLNTSDRGLMTSISPAASLISQAQLLAHELAHYQNARYARTTSRWLQEGMSEWAAERLLYRHFPRRAVHRYLRSLRFDTFFEADGSYPTDFPLDAWSSDSARHGYEKSLMFFDILAREVGDEALMSAFRAAVNVPMNSASFAQHVSRESGRDVAALYPFWVEGGSPPPGYEPEVLFQDRDGDELLGLDEAELGTDPNLADSDFDGFPDGEEFFDGTDPRQSALTASGITPPRGAPILVTEALPQEKKETASLLRLAQGEGLALKWSADFADDDPQKTYAGPVFWRPPYRIAARAGEHPAEILTRHLYVGGQLRTPPTASSAHLPEAARATTSLDDAIGVTKVATDGAPPAATSVDDAVGDLPLSHAAYDLKKLRATASAQALVVTLETRAAPDLHGERGDYVLDFEVKRDGTNGPSFTTHHSLTLKPGAAAYWRNYQPLSEELAASGVKLTFGAVLTVTIDHLRYASWAKAEGEKFICAKALIAARGKTEARDVAGCLAVPSLTVGPRSADAVATASVADPYQFAPSTLRVEVTAASQAEERAAHLAKLGGTALTHFAALGRRPFFDRQLWPATVHYLASGQALGSGQADVGAFLAAPVADEGARLDYLFVEQLARLQMADFMENSSRAPYWIQELYVQWLTSSALYRFYATREVRAFHAARLASYRCFVAGSCAERFSADMAPVAWTSFQIDSTGSVRSLLFMLRLAELVPAATLTEVFASFANELPTALGLKGMLVHAAPAQKAAIEDLWTHYVTGSGNLAADQAVILADFTDADGDGLWDYEERARGTSDGTVDAYFPP